MANTYLTVPFKDKDAAKALGARWDAGQRQWFVPDGRELTPFAIWLPDGALSAPPSLTTSTTTEIASLLDAPVALASSPRGVSLSQLLAGVSQAVAQAYRAGVWTMVEVVELRAPSGHVFLGVSERDARGVVLAKASAVIWESAANKILPEFERVTGAQLAPGIKLLVRARPVFKAQHGFSLEIDAIDPQYTLGDLEAKKREIRARLHQEGVFTANKLLSAPWDFNAVLVVAPDGAAGLGDFQAEANRLEKQGICCFIYAYSRFQGEGAAAEIRGALQTAMAAWSASEAGTLDAVVIIRGGGAVNDLAWLNDYDLARFICDLPTPVLTGIGHERDNTVLDEVAHTRFDTPSKVIAGIEQVIVKRVQEAKAYFEQVTNLAARGIQSAKSLAGKLEMTVTGQAVRHIAQARHATGELRAEIRVNAVQRAHATAALSRDALQTVKTRAMQQLVDAKRHVPAFWSQITQDARHSAQTASTQAQSRLGSVLARAPLDVARARQSADDAMDRVSTSARQLVRDGATHAEALMREIAGQGPEKTLTRGFAIVRSEAGSPVTRAAQVTGNTAIEIQFQDGRVGARTDTHL